MNTNQKAIDFFDKNDYETAMKHFHLAVKESRDIQSLHNLAWMYSYEVEDDEKALVFIKDAMDMGPSSHFPYNLLGEIYLRQEKWQLASDAFENSILIRPSDEAYHNLAIAKYHLGDVKEAAEYFLRVAGNSDEMMYSHVQCLVKLGKKTEALEKLDAFSEEAEEFVGEIALADLYVELDCFKEAIHWFEKGRKDYSGNPYWVSRFAYALFMTNNITRIYEVANEAIQQKDEEIREACEEECEDNWKANDKEEYIEQLLEEKNKYELMVEKILSGQIPLMEFETSMTGACYLFGCQQHNHPEYRE